MQVRTQTLVKNAIVQIDATPYRQWYHQHYGVEVGLKKRGGPQGGQSLEDATNQEIKRSNHLQRKIKERNAERTIDQAIDDQFATGRLYACISSRPGQCGRADGFIIEGKELEFYVRRMQRKKGKGGS